MKDFRSLLQRAYTLCLKKILHVPENLQNILGRFVQTFTFLFEGHEKNKYNDKH